MTAWPRTKPSAVAIGERRKPQPDGRPGFVRVVSARQGDLGGGKGVYEINLVDVGPLAVGGHLRAEFTRSRPRRLARG